LGGNKGEGGLYPPPGVEFGRNAGGGGVAAHPEIEIEGEETAVLVGLKSGNEGGGGP